MASTIEWRKANPEYVKAYAARYRLEHRAELNEACRRWRVENREKQRALHARWLAANPDYKVRQHELIIATQRKCREKNPAPYREATRRYKAANRRKVQAAHVKRRVAKFQRTPAWADFKKIEKVYEEARIMTLMMGEPWHVDHVIPLRGKRVSGLHVHANLQLLPGVENLKKLNTYDN